MPRIIAPIALLCFGLVVQANAQLIRSTAITNPISFTYPAPDEVFFAGAIARDGDSLRPYFVFTVLAPNASSRFEYIFVKPELEEEVPVANPEAYGPISETYPAGGVIEQDRGQYVLRAWVSPVRRTSDNKILRLVKGHAVAFLAPADGGVAQRSGPDFKTASALANGRIHKVSVDGPGIYKLDFNFFKDKLKVEPSTLDVNRIGVYGNGGGRIPQANNASRIDDIEPCAIQAVGFDDGQFNSGDYILWYAEGPDAWMFDPASRTYQMEKNIYDTKNHYYILLDGPGSPRLSERTAGTSGDYVSSASLDAQRIEDEKVNLLGRYRPPGSGQEWYGDEMAVVNQLDYTSRFDFADMITSDSLHYKLRFAIRAATSPRIFLRINQSEFSRTVGGVNLDNYESSFANDGVLQGGMVTGSAVTQLLVRYPAASGLNSRAWVDYLQLNFWRKNTYRSGKPIVVRDPRSAFLGTPTFEVTGLPASGEVWDITNPQMPVRQAYLSGAGNITFSGPAPDPELPSAFYCFDPSRDVAVPAYVGSVANQNLHGLNAADLIIVYHDEYRDAAETLAAHRRTHNGYTVIAVPTSQVFEEFGGGSKDPSALRDFARMIYLRDPGFHYLLLIGDATYDYLQRDPELPYHNYVPAFETEESLDPIRSFPADDFYALLDDQEGSNLIGAIDLAVGRFPVSSAEEANLIVQKILHYETSPAVLGDWRNRVVMVADDQDGNIHLGQADGLSNMTAQRDPVLNQEKLYLDAFPQQSTPGGDRYPAVNAALDQHVQNGALTVTYMGHGGPNGWTQERVLGINQAQSYSNINNLPLFITATCSFAGYDEPGFVSAGEHLLVNPKGGAIGLMTTVRAVFSGSNARLTEAVLKRIYEPDAPGVYPPIGEVLRRAKNDNALDTLDNNARKFTLLGDPSMLLAIPRYTVSVTQIGNVPVASGAQDTLSALEKTTVRGVILDHGGAVMTGFNGRVYLTLFDKVQKRKTLGNDADSPVREFQAQNKQLFRGTATVTNGEWVIEFVLPKDIDFNFGTGRISLYAEDGTTDAAGYFTGFVIGGVSSEGLADDHPPVVRLFMNDTLFVSGGITDPNPDIFILLSDDNGINVSGTSVGHDIEAILDGDERNSIILNDYYQAAQDDYRSGSVRYPLKNLAPGLHTLHVTAWDLANNPGQAYVEFVVRDDAGAVITNLGCDPNPFDGETRFHFEHNRPGSIIDARLRLFDLRGALVREVVVEDLPASGYRVDQLTWDGDNQTGAQVAAGMYIYRLDVTFDNGGTTERVEAQAGKVIRL